MTNAKKLANALILQILSFSIFGTARADSLTNSADYANIDGGASADTIKNSGSYVSADGGSGADVIIDAGDENTLSGGSGNDTIIANGNNAEIAGGSGNDVLILNSADSTADAGSGNDKISLASDASDNTIFFGSGNDTAYAGGEDNIFVLDSGKNVIFSYNDANAVSLASGVDYKVETLAGADTRISVKGGATVTLKNYTGEVNIIGGCQAPNGDIPQPETPPTLVSALKISNSADNTLIAGTPYDDTITTNGSNVTVSADDGNNIVTNESVRISGGKIDHDAGQNVIISTGGGKDTITTTAPNVTVQAGGNDDYVSNGNDKVFADLGDGANKIVSQGGQNTIIGGADADAIISRGGDEVSIAAGNGDNFVIAANGKGTITTGNDKNTVYASNNGNFVQTGGGDDQIFVGASVVKGTPFGTWTLNNSTANTVDAGAGNNNITFVTGSTGNFVAMSKNSGHTTITGGAENSLSIAGSTKYIVEEVSGGSGFTVSLEGGATATFTDTAESSVQIIGGTDITARALNISTSVSNSLIAGTNFDDSIIASGKNNTILGNAGDDTISAGAKSFVDGGEGDDVITVSGGNATVNSGGGDDTVSITGGNNLVILGDGTGNDIINGFSATDTLKFDEGAELETLASGNDLVIATASGDEFTIAGALNSKINLMLGEKTSILGGGTGTGGGEKILPLDAFQNFTFSLANNTVTSAVVTKSDGTTISAGEQVLDNAIADTTKWTDFEAAKKELLTSLRKYLKDDPINGAKKFARLEAGINLDNDSEDVGAITGSDAGGSTAKNASDIVKETGTINTAFSGNSFTVDGLQVYLDKDFSQLTADEKYFWQGLNSWWMPGALKLIKESFGENFSFSEKSSLTENKIRVVFYNESDGILASVSPGYLNQRGEIIGPLTLSINMKYYNAVIRGDVDGRSSATSTSLDRGIAHELTHAVVNAHVPWGTGNNGLPCFLKEGGLAEMSAGADDLRRSEILALLNDPDSFEQVLDASKKYRASGAYGGGYVFMRWLTWQNSSLANSISESDLNLSDATIVMPAGVSVKGAVMTVKAEQDDPIDLSNYPSVTKVNATVSAARNVDIVGTTRNESIKAGAGDNQLYGGAGKDTLYGGAGADTLFGGSGNDKLYGEGGNDTLDGGSGDDTLTGGAGSDLFIYDSGKDVIADFTAGADKIQVGGEILSASISGSNVVFTFADGALTVKGAKDNKITVIDAEGNETSQIYGRMNHSADKTAVTLASSFSGTLRAADYASTVKKIDATAVTKAINIVGNEQANTIFGSAKVDTIFGGAGNDSISGGVGNDKLYGDAGNDELLGGAGNDTLTGGAGDDTLTGGAGNDVFVYASGDGADVITDYSAGQDKIKLSSGTISGTSYSGSDVIFTVGSGTLTVNDAKGKKITITDANNKTTTQLYSGAVSGTSKLLVDDNFIGGETRLDDIAKITADYSSGDFSATNFENLAQISVDSFKISSAKK